SLKKYGFESCDPVDTPMVEKSNWMKIKREKPLIHNIIMARPTEKHVHAVKRIFRYLRGTVNRGLWYPKDSSVALTAFADADHAGCQDTRRSTSRSVQFLGERLISWSSKREMLHISPRIPSQSFAELPFEEEILEFLRDLGHGDEIRHLTNATPKPKASARKKKGDSTSSTTPTPTPITTAESAPRLSATAKGKQPSRATTPVEPSNVQRAEAEQLKIVLRKSRQETHISQQCGSGTDEGTGFKPGVPDVKSQVKAQVTRILPRIEESVNAQLEAEILTRSSHSSRTSYAVAAELLEMVLKKILIEKMEGNKSIQRSDEQRNLYKALIDAYEADKTIIESYGETAILKRRRDDDDDDQEGPSAGSDRGPKR
nr:hypothetical protein [Tanacetum cinerariifolium]